MTSVSEKLLSYCDRVPVALRVLKEDELEVKISGDKWSKKEILGHLIDSASNNLHRFVRGRYEDSPAIFYDQDEWVRLQGYQAERLDVLVDLWESSNRHLAHVIKNIPKEDLSRTCIGRTGEKYSLEFLIDDYLRHLEHHLKQIVPDLNL